MDTLLEIRSYHLQPGTSAQFRRLLVNESLPLLHRWGIDVVCYGPSLHDDDCWYLIRVYDGLKERQDSSQTFYHSQEWRDGPREAILAVIERYTTIVIRVHESMLSSRSFYVRSLGIRLLEMVCLACQRVVNRIFEVSYLLKATRWQVMLFDIVPDRFNMPDNGMMYGNLHDPQEEYGRKLILLHCCVAR
jgi:hypothetical protein